MKRIHPLIQATVIGASLAVSMSAMAGGDYSTRSGSAYEGRTGATGSSSAEGSAERAQRRDSPTGVGQTTGPQAGPTADGARGGGGGTADSATGTSRSGSMGATGSTGARGMSDDEASDSAIRAQRRDSPTGTGQTTGPQAGPTPDGARGGGAGTAGSASGGTPVPSTPANP